MGVVFFLGFAAVCIAIGIVPLIVGIVILVRRAIQKKKTGEKYRKRFIAGLALTGFGSVFAGLPILFIAGILLMNVLAIPLDIMDDISYAKEEAYFDKYVETGKTIDSSVDKLDREDFFILDGRRYVQVLGMATKYKDKHRGDAVANIPFKGATRFDKPMTLFQYKTDFSDSLLSLRDYVYCPEDELNKLMDYYHGETFQYTCDDADDNEFKISFEDEAFFDVMELTEGKLEKCSDKEFNKAVDKDGFTLEQKSEDGLFDCFFAVFVTDQEVYVSGIIPLYSENDNLFNENYRVIDTELAGKLRSVEKREKN